MNLIVIMLDSMRKDHVGCYGNQWIHTPNLDDFAKESVVFTRAFPEALPTLPVRRAMHTGIRTFPFRNYVPRKGDNVKTPGWEPIPEDQITMAEILKHEGYATAMFSSTYHIFKPSMNFHRGFDTWVWIRGQEADRYKPPVEKTVDIEDPKFLSSGLAYGCVGHSLHNCLPNMQDWQSEEEWFPARTFGSAIKWLENIDGNRKFLMVVDEFDPHEPWNAPVNFLELYFKTSQYKGRRIINTRGGPYEFREGELEYTRGQYAGEVTLCDKYVGRFLNKVKELGFWDNTIIFVVSDHGHNIMDHGVMHKVPSHMYPELVDLVFMMRHPNGEYAGTTCEAYVSHHDMLPTLLDLAGLTSPQRSDGRNIWEWVSEEKTDRRKYMTCRFGEWVWCRDEEYAFISNLDGEHAVLYNVSKDPEQKNNIANQNPKICREMYQRILSDAGGSIPRYETERKGHAWYEAWRI